MTEQTGARQIVERKLVTIMSADVAEYSRLMAENEEETVQTFRGHRSIFETLVGTHRGRIFNTAGDAILAEFGSAVEAVRCATEVQAALRTKNDQLPPSRQVKFRIGVNLGDVMLQGSDLLGDGVNVAARIQAAAAPGGICVSGSVYDQVRNKLSLSFEPMGERNYKNIPELVRTYSIGTHQPELHRATKGSAIAHYLKPIAVAAGVFLLAGGGLWAHSIFRQSQISQAQDGLYRGQVCLGPMRNDEARCYVASGILVRDGKISAKYPAKGDGLSNVIRGDISKSGDVEMEVNIVNVAGSNLATARLNGTLKNGQLVATGDGFRSFKVDWRRD